MVAIKDDFSSSNCDIVTSDDVNGYAIEVPSGRTQRAVRRNVLELVRGRSRHPGYHRGRRLPGDPLEIEESPSFRTRLPYVPILCLIPTTLKASPRLVAASNMAQRDKASLRSSK